MGAVGMAARPGGGCSGGSRSSPSRRCDAVLPAVARLRRAGARGPRGGCAPRRLRGEGVARVLRPGVAVAGREGGREPRRGRAGAPAPAGLGAGRGFRSGREPLRLGVGPGRNGVEARRRTQRGGRLQGTGPLPVPRAFGRHGTPSCGLTARVKGRSGAVRASGRSPSTPGRRRPGAADGAVPLTERSRSHPSAAVQRRLNGWWPRRTPRPPRLGPAGWYAGSPPACRRRGPARTPGSGRRRPVRGRRRERCRRGGPGPA